MPVRHRLPDAAALTRTLPQRIRPKTVRARTVALLTVPVVSLMVLWALATVSAVQGAWTLHQVSDLNAYLAGPIGNLVDNLQAERSAVLQYEASPRDGQQTIAGQRSRTTAATATLLDGVTVARADIAALAPDVNQRVNTVLHDLDVLQNDRNAIVALQMDWNGAYNAYTTAIEDALAVDEALTEVRDGQTAAVGRVDHEFALVGEMLARQDAIATSAQATGQMSPSQYQVFADALGGQHMLANAALSELTDTDRTTYQNLVNNANYQSLTSMQNIALGTGPGHPTPGVFPADQWRGAMQFVTQGINTIRSDASATATTQASAASRSQLTRAALTAILGLLAVLLTLVVSVRIGRGLVTELSVLHDSALELANRRLPQAMRRLRAGEKIDIGAAVPLATPGEGEIGEVGDALNAVQRAALQAAAERAELLTGVSGVFVNLARRSQSLVHRQLTMLDSLERRIENPDTLEDLFRLDHLATRMRRHAESLIIMSGSAPGRTWSRPVPLTNILRSAIAEVEDYARVEMRRMPELSVLGSAVSDLIHLIAELVENATSFSPPNTTVLVHGEPVGNGFVVEIDDRGLGMNADRMAEVNRIIADAHRLDLFESDRLGLFVVSRLANRQGISVSLRRSPYGGTTAVVLLPTALLTMAEPSPEADRRISQMDQYALLEDHTQPPRPAVTARTHPPDTDRAAPTAEQLSPPAEPVWPEPEPSAAPEPLFNGHVAAEHTPEDGPSTGGLPRRKRQANLAPGLRVTDNRHSRGADENDTIAGQVSPEQALTMMSGFQQGTIRGRVARPDDFHDT
jgi:signal transduction histidine kinase